MKVMNQRAPDTFGIFEGPTHKYELNKREQGHTLHNEDSPLLIY